MEWTGTLSNGQKELQSASGEKPDYEEHNEKSRTGAHDDQRGSCVSEGKQVKGKRLAY